MESPGDKAQDSQSWELERRACQQEQTLQGQGELSQALSSFGRIGGSAGWKITKRNNNLFILKIILGTTPILIFLKAITWELRSRICYLPYLHGAWN